MAIVTAGASPRPSIFGWFRRMREEEAERARTNPFLVRALEEEKREGQWIATVARTIALVLIALLLPFLNPTVSVFYYEAFMIAFIAIGWLQLRVAQVGQSRAELGLIMLDLTLLTFVCVVPSPLVLDDIPTAMNYRFDAFIYFFVILAVGTLAYSWRTILSMGSWMALLWLAGLIGVMLFGYRNEVLGEAALAAFGGYPEILSEIDPNSVQPSVRVQEIVVALIVAGILALKGLRSNRLLMKQADIAAERANLSRYFSPNMVDVLASARRDVGAVRNQEVAVMFVDIVGFTRIAESGSAQDVMRLLRRYHAVIEAAVFDNGGTLDKYLGDGVMATFGTPEAGPDDAANALKAAHAIIAAMEPFNRESAKAGAPVLTVSVGLHYGPVILGDIGPSRRLEFAVLGDTVNVASRLEAASRELGCRVVASDALVKAARPNDGDGDARVAGFSAAGAVALRGRSAAMEVWTL